MVHAERVSRRANGAPALRVLAVVGELSPAVTGGGPSRTVLALAQALRLAGNDVRVLTTDADGRGTIHVPAAREVNGVLVHTARRWFARPWVLGALHVAPGMAGNLVRAIRWADVVVVHGVWVFTAVAASACASLLRRPYVLMPHGSLEETSVAEKWAKKRWAMPLVRTMVRGARAVQFSSETERQRSRAWVPGDKGQVIPNPVAVDGPLAQPGHLGKHGRGGRNTARCWGVVGRLHPRKGLDLLLIALSRVEGEWTLTLVGPSEGNYRAMLEEQTRALGLTERVNFFGPVAPDDMPRVYADLDALLVPSRGESFGNTVIEALAQGTPVIAAETVPAAAAAVEFGAGVIVRGGADAWTEALRAEIRSPTVVDRERVRELTVRSFGSRAIGASYSGLLRSIVTDWQARNARR